MNGPASHLDWIILLVCSLCLASRFPGCCSFSKSWPTVFVDCNGGNDSSGCGDGKGYPCKTLQYVILTRAQVINSSRIMVSITPGTCDESGILMLDCRKSSTRSWAFTGSELSGQATILQISALILNCVVRLSNIHWKKSNKSILFDAFTSHISFENCSLKDSNIQFTGVNTNLSILHTLVDNCTSGDPALPIISLHTMYSYGAGLFIDDTVFSHNLSPVVNARYLFGVSVMNTMFLKNRVNTSLSESLVTVSASSIMLENLKFNQNLGSAFDVLTSANFTATNVSFSSNDGVKGSCLVVRRHCNANVLHSIFKNNTNPVIYIGDKDGVVIDVKESHFGCKSNDAKRTTPFVQAPDGINITFTNCTKDESCFVHCKNGEFLKSQLFCNKCPDGSFSFSDDGNVTTNSCQSCPVGSYSSAPGGTNCKKCPKGTYAQKEGSKSCKKCSNDFFTSHAGAGSCSELTTEFILVLVVSIPLIVIPLFILVGRHMHMVTKGQLSHTDEQYSKFNNAIQ